MPSSVHVRPDSVAMEWLEDGRHERLTWRTLVSADRTDSDSVACGIAYFEAGGFLWTHRHPESEIVHVLAGGGCGDVGGAFYEMRPGDTIFVPGGTSHRWVAGDDGMRLLFVFGTGDFSSVDYDFLPLPTA